MNASTLDQINATTDADTALRIYREEKVSEMYACHCGQSFHASLCHYRCPFCYCGTYTEAAKCPKLQQEARRKIEDARIPTLSEQEVIARWVKLGIIVEGCKGCEPFFKNPQAFAPRHKASSLCRSGKRSHCTCDSCF